MWENIIVWIFVFGAALYCGRAIYRLFSGKSSGCGCDDSCTGCDDPSLQDTIPTLPESDEQKSQDKDDLPV